MSSFLDSINKRKAEQAAKEKAIKEREENYKARAGAFPKDSKGNIPYSEIPKVEKKGDLPFVGRVMAFEKFYASRIVKDDGNSAWVNFPTITKDGVLMPDNNFILLRLINKVLEADWKNKELNKAPRDIHEGTEVYARVKYNKPKASTFSVGTQARPEERWVFQVLDRSNPGQVRVLTSKVELRDPKDTSEGDVKIDYSDRGNPPTVFKLFNELLEKSGEVEMSKRDVAIWKKPDGKSGKTVTYKVSHCKSTDLLEEFPEIANIAKYGDLTEDEAKLPLVNYLDYQTYKPVTLWWIYKNLRELFLLCDKDLKTSFTKELDAEIAKQRAEWEAKKTTRPSDSQTATTISNTEPEKSLVVKAKEHWGQHWESAPGVDKEEVLEALEDIKDGVVIWKNDVKLSTCDSACKTPSKFPSKCYHCFTCGKTLT